MGGNTPLDSLVAENVDLLRSGVSLVTSIPTELYRDGHDRVAAGGIGRHFRHVVEFYDCLIRRQDGTVDYERRPRDSRVERDPEYAVAAVERVIGELTALRQLPADERLTVMSEVQDAAGRQVPVGSSLGRELATLASHTVHHYAIMAMLLRELGVDVPRDFGIAPSTLRYLSSKRG